jgi:hypothetical protein
MLFCNYVWRTLYKAILSLGNQTSLYNFLIFVWFPMKIGMHLPCMLQNKACLEHMLKITPSSVQALLYACLQIGEDMW